MAVRKRSAKKPAAKKPAATSSTRAKRPAPNKSGDSPALTEAGSPVPASSLIPDNGPRAAEHKEA